jgi:hypothetical protein
MPLIRRGSSKVEQRTHKPLVAGSSPALATNIPLGAFPSQTLQVWGVFYYSGTVSAPNIALGRGKAGKIHGSFLHNIEHFPAPG